MPLLVATNLCNLHDRQPQMCGQRRDVTATPFRPSAFACASGVVPVSPLTLLCLCMCVWLMTVRTQPMPCLRAPAAAVHTAARM